MSFFSNIKLIADYLDIKAPLTIQFTPTYHQVAQTFGEWPVVINEEGYKIKLFEWGVVADYMNTPDKIKQYRNSMANARCEKIIDDRRSIWHRLKKQRCLVFTTGFFEHHDAGLEKKIPFFIDVKNEPVFCFAGLYNYAPLPDKNTGEIKGTFAIITRSANTLMAKIHNGVPNGNRMPLILTKELATKWLDNQLTDEEISTILQFEFPGNKMEAWPVNTIRTRKEDNESVIEKINYSDAGLLFNFS